MPVQLSPNALVSEVGEHQLIAALRERLGVYPDDVLGPGDDAAVLPSSDNRVVVSTDIAVAGRHFRLDWSTAFEIGRRVAAQNLSDINAMGACPTGLVVALVIPADTTVKWVMDLADGFVAECDTAGARLLGGDFSAGDSIVVSATALGELRGREPVLRSGAKPGDVVAIAGRLGWSAAGLTVLSRGFKSPKKVADAYRCPQPPYASGPAAALAGATAMIDVSDGLVSDLGHIADASGVSINVATEQLVIDDPVRDAAAAFNADPMIWILSGGEDHALVATLPAGTALPTGFTAIGEVFDAGTGEPEVLVDNDARSDLVGYDHFK